MPKQVDPENFEEQSSFNKKFKIALIVAVVIFDILLLLVYFKDDEKKVETPQENQIVVEIPAQIPAQTSTPAKTSNVENTSDAIISGAGQYKFGLDLPAGEYLAVGDGYVELSHEPTSNQFFNITIINHHYIEGRDGEYIKIDSRVKLYPVDKAPKFEFNPYEVVAGQYKIGTDIPAGEYKVKSESNGYFAVTPNSHDNTIIANAFMPGADETHYVNVTAGQYLFLRNAQAALVK